MPIELTEEELNLVYEALYNAMPRAAHYAEARQRHEKALSILKAKQTILRYGLAQKREA